MPRFELPPDLTPEEERAIIAALEEALKTPKPQLSPWALAGRAENLRYGRLQVRRDASNAWAMRGRLAFTREGTPTLQGRGDAR